MARTPMTEAQRIAKVRAAVDALAIAVRAAEASYTNPDDSVEDRRELWEAVEIHGATVHRQSRLLAGKSKGG